MLAVKQEGEPEVRGVSVTLRAPPSVDVDFMSRCELQLLVRVLSLLSFYCVLHHRLSC